MNKVRELAEYTSNRLAEIYEECNINIVTKDKTTTSNLEYAISNSLGFGGHNAVLALRKWSE